jgi:hypothetical protein
MILQPTFVIWGLVIGVPGGGAGLGMVKMGPVDML